MAELSYNWKRFWCRRTGRLNLADGGYLYDPDAEYGHIYNPDVVPAEKLAPVRCLALLGEPGIGKSRTAKAQGSILVQPVVETDGQVLSLDLKNFGDEDRLERKLLDSKEVAAWREGNSLLALSLDSLDECRMRISNLTAFLIEVFEQLPVERLYLRIACRTADWPNSFESALKRLWKDEEEAVQAFELAPLRRVDVIEAATVNGVDAAAFLYEVDRMSVVPLAIKPITLNFLLKQYQRSGSFPATQSELYLQGCQLLCEEPAEHRREAGLTGTFSAEQRLAVASRTAAVTVFTNRSAVWNNLEHGEELSDDVTLRALSGGSEFAEGRSFEVDKAAIAETLSSGLFSSRGPNRMGWAHQTYAEFLAARYVTQHRMALPQAMSLIVHPTDPNKKLVPQLHEAAACLAGARPDVFREIINVDPQVLLRSDIATTDEKDRATLAAALLQLFDEERLSDRDGVHGLYGKLAHPGLAEQVRPYIGDKSKGFLVRRVAADIAEACELRKLLDDLVTVALDTTDAPHTRANAAHAIVRLGDAASKAWLKPLAEGTAGDDPDDELKGCGLRALWPELIRLDQMLPLLTPPKNARLYGAYKGFLLNDFTEHLKPHDIPTMLSWLDSAPMSQLCQEPFEDVANHVVRMAWEHVETSETLHGLVRFLHGLLHKERDALIHGGKLEIGEVAESSDARRRLVVTHLVPLLSVDSEHQYYWKLSSRQNALIRHSDFEWLIDQTLNQTDLVEQRKYLILAGDTYDWASPEHTLTLFNAVNRSSLFEEQFGHQFRAVTLDSPEAEQQRRYHVETEERREERTRQLTVPDPPPSERVAAKLAQFGAGDLDAWWHLIREMTIEVDSTHYREGFEPDLTKFPGWLDADQSTRQRIVAAAEKYVVEQEPQTDRWLGTNECYFADLAAFRALRLLAQEAPRTFAELPGPVWTRWASVIVGYPVPGDTQDKEAHGALFTAAYTHAPQETLSALNILIDRNNERGDWLASSLIRKMEHCWDDWLKQALLTKAQDPKIQSSFVGSLLSELIARDMPESKAFAESLVPVPIPTEEPDRSRAQAAACALLGFASDGGWSTVWAAITQDTDFGRDIVTHIAVSTDRHGGVDCGQRLTDDQLADLYIWIVRHFPSGDLPYEPNGFVSADEQVLDFRDRIIGGLRQRGSCDALRRLVQELPERAWLKWSLLEAENVARRHTWVPPKPENIIKLGADRQRRFVENGDQLLEAITESLQRLEAKLQGETPAAFELWNEEVKQRKKRVWPKDENRFSDKVKVHLAEDLNERGIILGREVVIRDSTGGAPGERVDIHVDAVVQPSTGGIVDVITAIIEVKGCWNPELNKAMETQLVNRYLKESGCEHGLYLVGWFNCAQWDSGRQAPSMALDGARAQFDTQAATLSQGGRTVKAFVMNTALR